MYSTRYSKQQKIYLCIEFLDCDYYEISNEWIKLPINYYPRIPNINESIDISDFIKSEKVDKYDDESKEVTARKITDLWFCHKEVNIILDGEELEFNREKMRKVVRDRQNKDRQKK